MFDSHCHLHDAGFVDAEGALDRARAAGVRGFLLAGVDPDGWADEERLAGRHGDVAIALGVHPQVIARATDDEAEALCAALGRRLDERKGTVAAVGEIGLDGAGDRKGSLDRQARAFRAQLALARAHDLPVVLHVLRAHGRALSILRADGLPRAGGVMHSYSGGAELTRDYLALGLHVSFAGPVTREEARRTREAATRVPLERLLVETDAPFQTPPSRAPAQNEPAFLVDVVAALSRLRGEDDEAVARTTAANARRLFRIA